MPPCRTHTVIPSLSLFSLLFSLLFLLTTAHPYLILTHGTKCLNVDASDESVLQIHWHLLGKELGDTPDLRNIHEDMRQYAKQQREREKHQAHFEKEMRQEMDLPIILEISPQSLSTEDDVIVQRHDKYSKYDSQPKIHIIEHPRGVMQYETHFDGRVHVCLKSQRRHLLDAISLTIEEVSRDDDDKVKMNQEIQRDIKKANDIISQNEMAKKHISVIDQAIQNLVQESNQMLNNADATKNVEKRYHGKSEEMNRAMKWWPIFHIMVLVFTAITQMNHMKIFFKRRNIT